MDEAIQLLVASYNQESIEHDELVEKLELLDQENDSNRNLLKNYERDAGIVLEKAEKSDQQLAQANREREQALFKLKDVQLLLKAYKEIGATPKKVREKIKDYQTRLTNHKSSADQLKKSLMSEKKKVADLEKQVAELTNRLDTASINQLFRDGNDIVQTYPYHLGDMITGYDEKMTPLLYLHQSGRGGLILLNEDGEAELVDAPKGGIRPKKTTMEHCGKWLRRAKDKNWDLSDSDLESLSENMAA